MGEWDFFWTEEVAIESGGRYPLLLNRFHDHLEEYLIKGIVSVTDRLRYISFCCWAIGDIEIHVKPLKFESFLEAFRRREAALCIGTILLKPKTIMGNYTTYGRDVMRGKIDSVDKEYDTSFMVLPSNELGAYGQYYKGTMQSWGLTCINEQGIICLTEKGFELYKIMDELYSQTKYYTTYKGDKVVPGKVLLEWAEINTYDNITDEKHIKEREFYRDIIFHLDVKEVKDGRRDTFVIYLECIEKMQNEGCNFTEDYLSDILYYKKYIDEAGVLHNLELMPKLSNTQFHWMLYEMQGYFRWYISEYFRSFLKLLSGAPNGLSIDEVMNNIDQRTFNDFIYEYTDQKNEYYTMKLSEFSGIIEDIYDQDYFSWESALIYNSRNNGVEGFSKVAAGLIMMISLLKIQFDLIKNDSRYLEIRINLTADFWFKDILEIFEGLKNKSLPEVLELILVEFVIRQHNNAMYEKKDLRRCWFTLCGNKYQYQADSNSIWRPAKHNIICNFLFDMGLILTSEQTFILSDEGKTFYRNIRKEYYEE